MRNWVFAVFVSLFWAVSLQADPGLRKLEIALSGSLQNPVFSPDGAWLLFTRFRAGYNRGASDLYLYNLTSGALRVLVSDGSSNVNTPGASWNAARGEIVFSSTRGAHDEIWRIAANGRPGDEVQLTDRADLQAYEPTFSPDGKWIVFESHEIDRAAGVIMKTGLGRAGLGRYLALSAPGARVKQPNWSPAGGRILYQALVGDEWAIFLTDASAKAPPRRLTPQGISATDGVFSPDGKWIYFSGETPDIAHAAIFRLRLGGGVPERLTWGAGYDGAVSVAPNGRRIAFEAARRAPERTTGTALWLLDLPGAGP